MNKFDLHKELLDLRIKINEIQTDLDNSDQLESGDIFDTIYPIIKKAINKLK